MVLWAGGTERILFNNSDPEHLDVVDRNSANPDDVDDIPILFFWGRIYKAKCIKNCY